jgi:Uma2 family endonuclease
MATERRIRDRLEEKARLAADPAGTDTVTYDEFLAWADEDTLAEWVDGKVVLTSPASLRHQVLGLFLTRVLATFVELADLGMVLNAPFQMKLSHSGREPDVLFLAREHLDRLRDTYIDGAADLAVEIVSPDSNNRDRVTKLREYADGGVTEYWILDPDRSFSAFYQRAASGVYRQIALDAGGIYRAQVLPGFWLDTVWLRRDPLPSVESTVLAIAGEAYARYLRAQLRTRGYSEEHRPST